MTIDIPAIDIPAITISSWLIIAALVTIALYALNATVTSKLFIAYRKRRDLTVWNQPSWAFWTELISAGPVMWFVIALKAPTIARARREGDISYENHANPPFTEPV